MFKIALIAVNDDCEKKEESLKNDLTNKIASYSGFEVIDFNHLSLDEMIILAKKEADKTIIVYDALRGMNTRFAYAARKLFEENIHPILLISNSDHKNADISSANTSLAQIWRNEDPSLENWELNFHNLYFSYDTMGIDTFAEVETNHIDALMKLIS